MSVRMMNMVFERYPNGGSEMVLALAIADHAHDDGTNIFPSVPSLAKKTRQSDRNVQYLLRKMLESGWLLLDSHESGRGQRVHYRINPAWIMGENFAPINDEEKGENFAPINEKGCKPAYEKGENQRSTYKDEPSLEPSSIRSRKKTPIPKDWKPKPATLDKLSEEVGLTLKQVERYIPYFVDKCESKAYRYANFDSAFSNCVRDDWPEYRSNGRLAPPTARPAFPI